MKLLFLRGRSCFYLINYLVKWIILWSFFKIRVCIFYLSGRLANVSAWSLWKMRSLQRQWRFWWVERCRDFEREGVYVGWKWMNMMKNVEDYPKLWSEIFNAAKLLWTFPELFKKTFVSLSLLTINQFIFFIFFHSESFNDLHKKSPALEKEKKYNYKFWWFISQLSPSSKKNESIW